MAVPIIVLWTRMSLPKYVGRWNRKKGPPEAGHIVTLVLTDIEGSTELWEAFQEVCRTPSVMLHHYVYRGTLWLITITLVLENSACQMLASPST